MYFSGHSHSYSRFTADQHDGTTHIVVGGAGNDEHPYPSDGVAGARSCRDWCERAGGASAAKVKARAALRAKAGLEVGETHATTDQCKICSAGRGVGGGEPAFFVSDGST